MASSRQVAANQRNAKRSTGPRSPTGKAKVSANAVKHGLSNLGGKTAVLGCEDAAEFARFSRALRVQLHPVGELEGMLADRIASVLWRLKRIGAVEAGLFEGPYYKIVRDRARSEAASHTKQEGGLPIFDTEGLCGKTVITNPSAFKAAQDRADEAHALTLSMEATLGQVFKKRADTFSTLGRYERDLWRAFGQAFSQLQELQAARLKVGAPSAPVIPSTTFSSAMAGTSEPEPPDGEK